MGLFVLVVPIWLHSRLDVAENPYEPWCGRAISNQLSLEDTGRSKLSLPRIVLFTVHKKDVPSSYQRMNILMDKKLDNRRAKVAASEVWHQGHVMDVERVRTRRQSFQERVEGRRPAE